MEHLKAIISFKEMFIPICNAMRESQEHPDSDSKFSSKAYSLLSVIERCSFAGAMVTVGKVLVCHIIYWHLCNRRLLILYTFSNKLMILRAKLVSWERRGKLYFIHFLRKVLNCVKIMKSALECPDELQNESIGIITQQRQSTLNVLPTLCVYSVYGLLLAAAASAIP